MIVKVEEIFTKTFSEIETVPGQNPIWFHYGDTKELDSVLIAKEGERKYPLLWYVMPNKLKNDGDSVSGQCTFILAHNSTLEWFNDQRFKKIYDEILFPYMENFLTTIKRSHNITSEDEYSFTNYPNFGVSGSNKTEQIDYWDAIKIEIDLKIYNDYNC